MLNVFLKNFFLLFILLQFNIHAQYDEQDFNYNNNGGDYSYNDNNNYGSNAYNGYWSSNGNGYGYGYYPNTNCLYNYVPPYCMSYLDPGFSRLLYNLSPSDLQSLISTPYSADQPFLSQLQAQNPQLYNQLNSAYSSLDPSVQQNLQTLMSSVVGAVQQFVSSLNGQAVAQSTPLFNQNFPKFSNLLRGPGMNAFARQQNPFMTNVPSISSVAGVPNINPLAQNSQNQPAQLVSSNPSTGGVGELVGGILNTVSSAIGMGNGKK
ncbi:hypothetical protein niasHT_015182 [Heterodera trifolii]|uniref:Uncharacterized protein n=1 Tax=Heterodera trifolii TaxID=157864 RepID=A0ABD2LC41_9BILA